MSSAFSRAVLDAHFSDTIPKNLTRLYEMFMSPDDFYALAEREIERLVARDPEALAFPSKPLLMKIKDLPNIVTLLVRNEPRSIFRAVLYQPDKKQYYIDFLVEMFSHHLLYQRLQEKGTQLLPKIYEMYSNSSIETLRGSVVDFVFGMRIEIVGNTLKDDYKPRGDLVARARGLDRWLVQLRAVCACLRDVGFVHGDFHMDNIAVRLGTPQTLRGEEFPDTIKVFDLDLSCILPQEPGQAKPFFHKKFFEQLPEQARKRQCVDPMQDFAYIFYHMLRFTFQDATPDPQELADVMNEHVRLFQSRRYFESCLADFHQIMQEENPSAIFEASLEKVDVACRDIGEVFSPDYEDRELSARMRIYFSL